MNIQATRPADTSQVYKLVSAAFGDSAEADLVTALQNDGDIKISYVAVRNQTIIGHIILSKMIGSVRALALAPVSVLPDYQNQGIGSTLIIKALAHAKRENWDAVFLLGHTEYYSRFDFSAETAKPFISPYAGPHFMAIELQNGALDGKGGPIDYAPAFATLS